MGVFRYPASRGTSPILPRRAALGATLLVALNSDAVGESVSAKGEERPGSNPLTDRMAVVAALESVHIVTWFDEDTPLALILACRPEALAKGGRLGGPKRWVGGSRKCGGWGRKRAFDPLQATSAPRPPC